jgi:hypothetical protein
MGKALLAALSFMLAKDGVAQSRYVVLTDSVIIESIKQFAAAFEVKKDDPGVLIVEFERIESKQIPRPEVSTEGIEYYVYDIEGQSSKLDALYRISLEDSNTLSSRHPPVIYSTFEGRPVLFYCGLEYLIRTTPSKKKSFWKKFNKHLPDFGINIRFMIFQVRDGKIVAATPG